MERMSTVGDNLKQSGKASGKYDPRPYQLDLNKWPNIVSAPPGLKSREFHERAKEIMHGYSISYFVIKEMMFY